jgi:hypothetical protein
MNLVEENAEPTGVHDFLADLGEYKNMYVTGPYHAALWTI